MVAALESVKLQCRGQIQVPMPLCKHHYHLVYNLLQPTQTNCRVCDICLKHTQSRLCPQPDVIEAHLRDTVGFEGHITSADKVCNSCYKSHLVVLQESQTISRDSDLQRLINTFEQASTEADRITSVSELLQAALITTTIQVGNKPLAREVILLPTVHNQFQSYTTELAAASNQQGSVVSVSAMWVLSGLAANLQHHMTYSCMIRKYGTLLYRSNTDLIPSLIAKSPNKLNL